MIVVELIIICIILFQLSSDGYKQKAPDTGRGFVCVIIQTDKLLFRRAW